MKNTVADLIEYLKTLPPEATVNVMVTYSKDYMGDYVQAEELDIDVNTTYYSASKTLELGCS